MNKSNYFLIERKFTMILLSDKRIFDVPCIDNNEKYISLREIHKNIIIDESRSQISNKSDYFCYARETVAKKLIEALDYLPMGYQFLIKEAYRPLSQQKKSFEETLNTYKLQFPEKNDTEIYDLTSQYVAPVDVAGHPTGGAIDITLFKDGIELNMGTEYNASAVESQNRSYLDSPDISESEKINRNILAEALEKVGFINYPTEWWHWSYGDRYWAFFNNCPCIYSANELE